MKRKNFVLSSMFASLMMFVSWYGFGEHESCWPMPRSKSWEPPPRALFYEPLPRENPLSRLPRMLEPTTTTHMCVTFIGDIVARIMILWFFVAPGRLQRDLCISPVSYTPITFISTVPVLIQPTPLPRPISCPMLIATFPIILTMFVVWLC